MTGSPVPAVQLTCETQTVAGDRYTLTVDDRVLLLVHVTDTDVTVYDARSPDRPVWASPIRRTVPR